MIEILLKLIMTDQKLNKSEQIKIYAIRLDQKY